MRHARSKRHFRALSIVRSACMVVVLAGFNVTAVANAPGIARDVGDQNAMVLARQSRCEIVEATLLVFRSSLLGIEFMLWEGTRFTLA